MLGNFLWFPPPLASSVRHKIVMWQIHPEIGRIQPTSTYEGLIVCQILRNIQKECKGFSSSLPRVALYFHSAWPELGAVETLE